MSKIVISSDWSEDRQTIAVVLVKQTMDEFKVLGVVTLDMNNTHINDVQHAVRKAKEDLLKLM